MGRYIIDVEVQGNAEAKLDKVGSSLGKVASQAKSAGNDMEGMGGKLDNILGTMKAGLIEGFSDKLGEIGHKFVEMSSEMISGGKEFASKIVEDASSFENAQSEMRFAFGKDWKNVYNQVLDDSARLTFTFQDVSKLASSLGRMDINPFGGTSAASQLFKSKTGENVRALDILQDTADSVGKSTDDLTVSLRNFFSGSSKSLQDRFDIPKDKINAWKAATASMTTQQEKYNYTISQLGLMFGGAGLEKAENWTKAVAQIPDLLEQIRAGAGMPGLKIMSAAVRDFVDHLSKLAKDKDVMDSLAGGFMLVAQGFSVVVRAGGRIVDWIHDIIVAAPWIPKVVVGLGAIVTAMSAFAAVATVATTAVIAVVAAFLTVGWEVIAGSIVAVGVAFVAMAPLLVLLAGGAVALGVGADMIKSKWGGDDGVFGIFDKGKLIFQGIGEMLESFNGQTTSVSEETGEKLKKAGLIPFFDKVDKVIFNVNAGWEAFNDTLDQAGAIIGPVIVPLLGEIGDLMNELGVTTGVSDAALDASNGTTGEWAETGKKMAVILAEIGRFTVQLTRALVLFARIGLVAFAPVIATLKFFYDLVVDTVSMFDKLASNKMFRMVMGLGAGTGKGEAGSWIHKEGDFKMDELKGLRRGTDNKMDFGLGDDFNKMSAEDKAAKVKELVDTGELRPEFGARVMKGRAVPKAPSRGVDADAYYNTGGYSISEEQAASYDERDFQRGGSRPKNGANMSSSVDTTEQHMQNISTSLSDFTAMVKSGFAVNFDSQEVGKIMSKAAMGTAGRE